MGKSAAVHGIHPSLCLCSSVETDMLDNSVHTAKPQCRIKQLVMAMTGLFEEASESSRIVSFC